VAEPERTAQGLDRSVELGGYRPELKRTLGSCHRQRLAGGDDHARPARFNDGEDIPGRDHAGVLRRWYSDHERLDRREGAFNLGRFEVPIAITALLWVACALFVLTVPGEARLPDLIVVGLAAAGGVFFLGLRTFRPEALETEPGEVGAFKH
jgi:hypothetical protein